MFPSDDFVPLVLGARRTRCYFRHFFALRTPYFPWKKWLETLSLARNRPHSSTRHARSLIWSKAIRRTRATQRAASQSLAEQRTQPASTSTASTSRQHSPCVALAHRAAVSTVRFCGQMVSTKMHPRSLFQEDPDSTSL